MQLVRAEVSRLNFSFYERSVFTWGAGEVQTFEFQFPSTHQEVDHATTIWLDYSGRKYKEMRAHSDFTNVAARVVFNHEQNKVFVFSLDGYLFSADMSTLESTSKTVTLNEVSKFNTNLRAFVEDSVEIDQSSVQLSDDGRYLLLSWVKPS